MNAKTLRASLLAVTTAIALCAAIVPLAAHAYDENSTAAINVDAKGVGLKGHDPVAYFTDSRATKGKAEFMLEHRGSVFHFASAANRDAFAADAAKYAPQYGGFCAFGVAGGYKAAIDPAAFSIVDGKLYLNYNREVQRQWSADVPGFIARADRNWPTAKSQSKVHE